MQQRRKRFRSPTASYRKNAVHYGPRPLARCVGASLLPTSPTVRGLAKRAGSIALSDAEFEGTKPGTVFMFPGQGAQVAGMGKEAAAEVPAAAELYAKAADILGYDLLEIDDKAKLDTTAVREPAIFVGALAAVEKLRASEGGADTVDAANMCMGLSLGEYTALAFAGAISFEDGVKITKARGEAMQAASDAASSGMVSVIGLDSDKVAELLRGGRGGVGREDCDRKLPLPWQLRRVGRDARGGEGGRDGEARLQGAHGGQARRRGRVPHGFHGARRLEARGGPLEVEVSKPRIPVISNVDAKAHSDPAVIKDILTKQVTAPVQWETIMKDLVASGFDAGYELGPGKVLSGIMKRIDKKAPAITNVEV